MQTISEEIKKIRIEQGLTQKDLSNLTCMSLSFITKFEQGLRTPRKHTLMHMLNVLELDTQEKERLIKVYEKKI